MVGIKLNFLILEDFLKEHPEYTDEIRNQVLAMDTDPGPIQVQNMTETTADLYHDGRVRTFLNSQELQPLFRLQNVKSDSWQTAITQYAIKRMSGEALQEALPKEMFPPGYDPQASAQQNLELFLSADWLLRCRDDWRLLSPIKITATPATRWNPDNTTFNIGHNALFWKIVDPDNKEIALKAKFAAAFDEASNALSSKSYYSPYSIVILELGDAVVRTVAEKVQSVLHMESPLPISTSSEIENAGLILQPSQRQNFETLLSTPDFLMALQDEPRMPPNDLKGIFLTFFPNSEDIIYNPFSKTMLLIMKDGQEFTLASVLWANGYMCENDSISGTTQIWRILKIAQSHVAQTSYWKSNAIDVEPLNQSMANDTKLPGQYAYVPFLCRTGLVDTVKSDLPGAEAVFKRYGAQTIADTWTKFTQDYLTAVQLNDSGLLYMQRQSANLSSLTPFVEALKTSAHPDLAIVLLLWRVGTGQVTTREEDIISILLAKIITSITTSKHSRTGINSEEILIELDETNLINAWVDLNPARVTEILQRLADMPKKQIHENIRKISNREYDLYLETKQSGIEERKIQTLAEPSNALSLNSESFPPTWLEISKIKQHLRLESTHQAIDTLPQPVAGRVNLTDLISLSLRGPENVDLKRALWWVLPRDQNAFSQFQMETYSNDPNFGKLQWERLPARRIASILLQSDNKIPSTELFAILIGKNPKLALKVWETLLIRYEERGEFTGDIFDDHLKFKISNTFDSVYTCTLPESREIVLRHKVTLEQLLNYKAVLIAYKSGEIQQWQMDLSKAFVNQRFSTPEIMALSIYTYFSQMQQVHPGLVVTRDELKNLLMNYYNEQQCEQILKYSVLPNTDLFADAQIRKQFWTNLLTGYESGEINPYLFTSAIEDIVFALPKMQSEAQEEMVQALLTVFEEAPFSGYRRQLIKMVHLPNWSKHTFSAKMTYSQLMIGMPVSTENLTTAGLVKATEGKTSLTLNLEVLQKMFDLNLLDSRYIDTSVAFHVFTLWHTLKMQDPNLLLPDPLPEELEKMKEVQIACNMAHLLEGKSAVVDDGGLLVLKAISINFPKEYAVIVNQIRRLAQAKQLQTAEDLNPNVERSNTASLQTAGGGIVYAQTSSDLSQDKFREEIFPEAILAENFAALVRIDIVDFPDTILENDKTLIDTDEIPSCKETIEVCYDKFLKSMDRTFRMVQKGIDIDTTTLLQQMQQMQNNNTSPWLQYASALVSALFGDKEAEALLWQYQNGSLKMTANQQPFLRISQELLKIGEKILIYLDPERFFYGLAMTEMTSGKFKRERHETAMGMIEKAHPLYDQPQIDGHFYSEPQPEWNEDPDSVMHATMVAQTLLGNPGPNRAATGQIQPYVLNVQSGQSPWDAWNELLKNIVTDIKHGIPLSVVNISLGLSGYDTAGKEYDAFLNSDLREAIQNNLDFIFAHHVPIVIAAGNLGERQITAYKDWADSTMFYNFSGTLDTRIIVVAATTLRDTKQQSNNDRLVTHDSSPSELGTITTADMIIDEPYEFSEYRLSSFSSRGTPEMHPTVAAPGENFDFFVDDTLERDVQGTSFASPFVARLVAGLKSIYPGISIEMLHAILKTSAQDLSNAAPGGEGSGLVMPRYALYLAMALRPFTRRQVLAEFAEVLELSDTERTNLDFLARRLRLQTFFDDTTKPGFGL